MSQNLRVLVLADDCNPDWPSLPVVGYKYARALARVADVTLVTHVRNRQNIEKANELNEIVHFIDNEWIAAPMYRLASFLRRGDQVAWSTHQIMAYLPYLAFEMQALRMFRDSLKKGKFDLVHRITPMSPTLPSYASGRTKQPFLIGPLNGNLDWPKAFSGEQKREREGLRRLRGAYRGLPFASSTFRNAACIMAGFEHTIADLPKSSSEKIISFPEIGFDKKVFNSTGRQIPFSGDQPKKFMFAGRLVPYKLPEAAIRAFVTSVPLKSHILHILGDGPEQPRLERIVAEAGARDRVLFEGRKTQAEVADFMRRCDGFVFPSIRELGAGVVIEAMASGMVCIVTNYGAPGDLVGEDRGLRVELKPLNELIDDFRKSMEYCLSHPENCRKISRRAQEYAEMYYDWNAKAEYTAKIYNAVMKGEGLQNFNEYR